jgi:prophage tail gpP-like protein
MPNFEEWCEVRTVAGVFRDWTSVQVRYSFENNWLRQFQLELAEVTPTAAASGQAGRVTDQPSLLNPGGQGQIILQRLKPGDRVDIALAGQLVIESGYIKIRQSASDAERHGVQVIGLSKAGPIREVSVDIPGGQFRNQTLTAIANKVLAPIGIKFRLENAPAGADTPFPNVIVHDAETPWDLIQRLARNRSVWLRVANNGDLVGGDGSAGGGVALEEGKNIIAIQVYIEFPWVDSVVAHSQASGSDDLWGRPAAEISAKATIPQGDPGKKVIVHAEEPARANELKLRADMEAKAIVAATLRVLVTHRGWLKPGQKALWELGESVTVISPTHFPFAGGRMTLRVWGVTYSQDNARGTITQVELVNEATFSQRNPNAAEPAPFGRTSSNAVTEDFA